VAAYSAARGSMDVSETADGHPCVWIVSDPHLIFLRDSPCRTRCPRRAPASFPGKPSSGNRACSGCRAGQVTPVRESATKSVGKPDAGKRHVRFDERGWNMGRRYSSVPAPNLDSTPPPGFRPACLGKSNCRRKPVRLFPNACLSNKNRGKAGRGPGHEPTGGQFIVPRALASFRSIRRLPRSLAGKTSAG
jgi:hypothetical protein